MPNEDPRPGRGMLLVARPHLLDPNFMHSVVLLCDHDDEEGSLGFVLNRPSENALNEVLRGDHDFQGRSDRVFLGGPVGLDSLAIFHREPDLPGSMQILPGVWLGGSPEDLGSKVRAAETPEDRLRFMVGYAGWGKGQLSREMEENTWVLCPGRPEWVFDADPKTLWRRVLRSMGGPFSTLANYPADPSLN